MAAHAGEEAHKTGNFHCGHCDETVHVEEGNTIPECPNGHEEFDSRRNGPGTKS